MTIFECFALNGWLFWNVILLKKMKFSNKNFVSKFDRIRSFLRIWSHLLKNPYWKILFFVQCHNYFTCTNRFFKTSRNENIYLLLLLAITWEYQHLFHTETFYLQYLIKHTFCLVEINMMLRFYYMPLVNHVAIQISYQSHFAIHSF